MILKSLILEQLERDGSLRSFKMQPDPSIGDLIVAMMDEYEEDREGPFHFLDDKYAGRYREGFAQCRVRQVGKKYFYKHDDEYHFETGWTGIPTEQMAGFGLSYYALSLPQYGILTYLSVRDPRVPNKEFRRTVMRDDSRDRFVIYLECKILLWTL